MCCTWLTENAGPKKSPKIGHLSTIEQLYRAILACARHFTTSTSTSISSQLRHISKSEKRFLNSNISPTCPHSMVNFGPLAAEIRSGVWDTPANFNGFRILAALLQGTRVAGFSQTAALNRERHLYSAGRPSSWAFPTF